MKYMQPVGEKMYTCSGEDQNRLPSPTFWRMEFSTFIRLKYGIAIPYHVNACQPAPAVASNHMCRSCQCELNTLESVAFMS
jgi:hypothetical protein